MVKASDLVAQNHQHICRLGPEGCLMHRWFAAYQMSTTKDVIGVTKTEIQNGGTCHPSHNQLLSDQEWNTLTDQSDLLPLCHTTCLPKGMTCYPSGTTLAFHEASWCWPWEFQASERNFTGSYLGSQTYWSSSKSLPCIIILLVLLPFGTPRLSFQQGWTWLRHMQMGLQGQRIQSKFSLINWWEGAVLYVAFILSQGYFSTSSAILVLGGDVSELTPV